MVLFSFAENLERNLQFGYTDPSMIINDVSCSWVVSYHQSVCFCGAGADDK